jgi:hypothetical protein
MAYVCRTIQSVCFAGEGDVPLAATEEGPSRSSEKATFSSSRAESLHTGMPEEIWRDVTGASDVGG